MIDTPNGFIERDAKIIISPYHLEIYWLSFKDLPVDHDLLVGDHCCNVMLLASSELAMVANYPEIAG